MLYYLKRKLTVEAFEVVIKLSNNHTHTKPKTRIHIQTHSYILTALGFQFIKICKSAEDDA